MDVTNDRAEERLLARIRRFEDERRIFTEMNRLIGQPWPLREILDRIATQVAELLGAPFCAILLCHSGDGLLTIEGACGLDRDYIACVNANRTMRLDTIMGLPSDEVFRTGQPQVWADVRAHPSFARLRAAVQHQGYTSMVAVPLSSPDGILGTLNCYRAATHGFDDDEVALLTTIATHVAIAIHNANLINQLNASIKQLSELNAIIQRQHAVLTRSEDIHLRLTNLVLEERGVQAVVETLALLLGCGVALYDQRLELIADASAPGTPASAPIRLSPGAPIASAPAATQTQALRRLPAGPHASAPALIGAIGARGKTLGYLVVPERIAHAGELEQRAIEHAITVCALELVKQRAAADAERRLSSDFLADVLAGRFATSKEILRRADYLGYDLAGPHHVLVGAVDQLAEYLARRRPTEAQLVELRQHLADLIDQTVRHTSPRAILIPQGEQTVILAPARAAGPDGEAEVAVLADALVDAIGRTFPGLTVSVGLSAPVVVPIDFGRGHQEALDALAIARNLGSYGGVISFDKLGVYSLLLKSSSRDELLRFAHRTLDPLIAYERKRPTPLLQTLEAFLQLGRSPQRIAALLQVHANTIKHRLQQIHQITGIELDDTQRLFELQLALLVRRLVGPHFDRGEA
ncbi:MAG: GAF domain-containing protein [Kouleothrix sp.]|jgi:DNA-binding PucR family transcriptional regulator|nr:GAF domain-containing protein [Kouleothrix sp.]